MNKLGISSGCYYPDLTENIIADIYKAGISTVELFINTHSEMSDEYLSEILKKFEFYGIRIGSVHPFSSFAESMLFFSDYPRRFADGLEMYDRFFEICKFMGADVLNFHGLNSNKNVPFEKYCEVYATLFEHAKKFDVIFSQENVRNTFCGNLDFIGRLSDHLGNEVRFTFDIKQAHMMGYDPLEFVKRISDKLCLVHINDFDENNNCLLPGAGKFEIDKLVSYLKRSDYRGNYIIEVYSSNYSDKSEIVDAVQYIKKIIKEYA